MKKKVLIITYDMLPYSFTWGGCQRMYYFAKTLEKNGIETHVFGVNKSQYNTFGMELLKNTHFVDGGIQNSKIQTNSELKKKKVANYAIKSAVKSIGKKIDRILFNEITDGRGLLATKASIRAYSDIIKLLNTEKFDVIVISAPPFMIFSFLNVLKKYTSAKIIMDYRDPWNSWHSGNLLCTRREKKFQKKTDFIVCTNKYLCEEMSEKYKINRAKYKTFPNGFSGELPRCDRRNRNDCFTIVYAGSIDFSYRENSYRNANKLIKAYERVLASGIENIKLIFVGVESLDDENVKALIEKFGKNMEIIGHLDTSKAKEYILMSDMALVLHTVNDDSGKYLVSGKLYDYIQCKRFILSIGRKEGLHAKILSEYNIGVNVENEVAAIENAIAKCYELWLADDLDGHYINLNINQFSRNYSMRKYADFISEL